MIGLYSYGPTLNKIDKIVKYFLFGTCLLAVIFLGGMFLSGFDLTDESYYLLHAKYANHYPSVSHFGFYTGILYRLAFKNIFIFRIFGMVVLLSASFYAAYSLLNYFRLNLSKNLLPAFILSTTSLQYYAFAGSLYLPTPSYNWLALVSSLIYLGGFFALLKTLKIHHTLFFTLGCWLSWMSKPPLAVGIFLITVIISVITFYEKYYIQRDMPYLRKLVKRFIVVALFLLLFLVGHIVLFENSIADFFGKYIDRFTKGNVLLHGQPSHFEKMLSYFKGRFYFLVRFFNVYNLSLYGLTVLALLLFLFFKVQFTRKVRSILFLVSLLLPFIYHLYNHKATFGNDLRFIFPDFLFLFIVLVSICTCTSVMFFKHFRRLWLTLYIRFLIFVFLIASLPFFVTFGTTNNYSTFILGHSGPLFFASFIVANSNFSLRRVQFAFLFVFTIFSVYHVYESMKTPYRIETSLFAANNEVTLWQGNSRLFVNDSSYRYINSLQTIAKENKWQLGNMLIDMTGGTPGAAVILGAFPPGKAWTLGGYPKSEEFVIDALKEIDLTGAWILTTQNGRMRLKLEVLNILGIDLEQEYERAGSLEFRCIAPENGCGSFAENHTLWRPIRQTFDVY